MKFIQISVLFLLTWQSHFQLYACTTAILSRKCTSDQRPLLWKHRDSDCLNNKFLYFTDGEYDYIGLVNSTDSSTAEVWAGFNRTGFAIMNSASYNLNLQDTTRLKDQEGLIMKKALQSCATLSDFEKLLTTLPKPLGVEANFGVIDAFGGAAYYETNQQYFIKFDVNDPRQAPFGYLIRTNYSVTGETDKGYGYIRYTTTEELFDQTRAEHPIDLRVILQEGSRSLKHSLTGINLNTPQKYSAVQPQYVCFRDYIPRHSSSATIVVQGIRAGEVPELTTMWTILGFQLCSVAIPTWISATDQLPTILTASSGQNAPLCNWALHLKDQCFSIKRGSGDSYLNIAALMNRENLGIMQRLAPLENKILENGSHCLARWRESGIKTEEVIEFYNWVDSTVTLEFQKILGKVKTK